MPAASAVKAEVVESACRRMRRAPVLLASSMANGMRWSRSLRSVATRMVSGCVQRRVSESRMANTSCGQACHRRTGRDVPENTAKRDLNHIAKMCPVRGIHPNDQGAAGALNAPAKWPDRDERGQRKGRL